MLPPPECPRGHVLVVDDDPGVRGVCRTLLHALGYGAAEASCGEQAIATLASNDQRVQLVLLDLEMPGMRGDEVLRTLKATLPAVRVLLMSGHLGRDLAVYLGSGADGVLRKPFGLAALDASVVAALGA